MRRFFHPIRSRLAGEEGFTLIELMAALVVLTIGIFGVAQLSTNMLTKSLYSRERDAMIGEANRQIENLRSTSFTNLQLNPSGAIPSTYTDDDGVAYTPLVAASSSTNYVNYEQAVAVSPFTFTVRTIIAAVDDPADGTGGADQNTNIVDFKKVILRISAPEQGGFTYKLETIIRDTSTDPVTPVQGIQVQILDTDANVVNDDTLAWTIDISGAGIEGEEIDEGMYDNFGLQAGTYTCTIKNVDGSTQDWYPNGQPTAISESFTCVVTAGQITTYQRTWVQTDTCDVLTGVTGDLTVQVNDNAGTALPGATVDPAPSDVQSDPAAQTTSSLGGATFTAIATGPYTITVSKTGYVTKSDISVCVTQTPGEPIVVSLATSVSPSPSASPTPSNPTVNVYVKYTAGGTKTFRVYLADGVVVSQTISKTQTKVFTFTPAPGTYFVHVYCVAGAKENLKAAEENQTFALGTTYIYPGPTTSNAYVVTKC